MAGEAGGWGGGGEALKFSNLALLLVVFTVTAQQTYMAVKGLT